MLRVIGKTAILIVSLLALVTELPAFAAQEGPQSFTLDGRLWRDTGSATSMLDPDIEMKIQIVDPSQDCILYEEVQHVSTLTTGGYFAIRVGSTQGSLKRGSDDSGHSMSQVYSNTMANLAGKSVTNGAACTYYPSQGEARYLRVQVTPSGDKLPRVLQPYMTLDTVPSAIVAERAETFQGFYPENFLFVNSINGSQLTQSNLETVFSSTNYPRLTNLLESNGVVTSIVAGKGLTGGTITGSGQTINIDVGTGANQIVQLDMAGKLPDLDGSALRNLDGASITSGTVSYSVLPATILRNGGNASMAPVRVGSAAGSSQDLQLITGGLSRLNVTSTGLVGVGTASPTTALDVNGSVRVGTDTSPCTLDIMGAIHLNGSDLQYCDGTNWATISTGAAGTYLQSSGGTLTGALNIASGGASVVGGINNNTGGISNTGSITGVGPNITGSGALTVAAGSSAQDLNLKSSTTGSVNLQTGNGTALSIVDSGTTADNHMTIAGSASGAAPVLSVDGVDQDISLVLAPKGSGNTIFPYGNVGIGVNNPIRPLQIESNMADAQMALLRNQSTDPAARNYLTLSNGANGFDVGIAGSQNPTNPGQGFLEADSLRLVSRSASGNIDFLTGGNTQAMRINSQGKVGVGTASPVTMFDVAGSIRVGNGNEACDAGAAGTVRYNSGAMEFCDGSTWGVLATTTDAVATITGTSPIFVTGTATAPVVNIQDATVSQKGAMQVGTGLNVTSGVVSVTYGTAANTTVQGNDSRVVNAAQVNASNTFTMGNQTIQNSADQEIGLIIMGSAGQTAKLAEFRTSSGTVLYSISNAASPVAATDLVSKAYVDNSITTANLAGVVPVTKGGTGLSAVSAGDVLYATGANTLAAGTPDAAGLVDKSTSQTIAGAKTFSGMANFSTNGFAVGTNQLVVSQGNVGVGTLSPQSKLDVAGSVKVGADTAACSVSNKGAIRLNGSVIEYCDGSAWLAFSSGGSGTYVLKTGDTMSGALTISSGGANISGGASVNGGFNNNSGDITNAGSITGVGSDITGTGALTVSAGGLNQNLGLLSSGSGSVNLGTASGTAFKVVDLGATAVNYLTAKGAAAGGAPTLAVAGSDANINLAFSPKGTGNTLFPNGRVGIGTATPTTPLDVNGVIKGTQVLVGDGSMSSAGLAFSGNSSVGFFRSGTAINTAHSWGGTNGWSIGPNSFSHLSGAGAYLSSTNTATDPAIAGSNSASSGIFFPSQTTVAVSTNAIERLRVDGSGNIGIGTTTPQSKLDVGGSVKVGTDNGVCAANNKGAIRLNGSVMEYCTGAAWVAFSTGSSGTYVMKTGDTMTGALTISSGGASINGGLNNNTGNITNAGDISGVGNITGSGAVTLSAGGVNQNLNLYSTAVGSVNIGSNNGMSLSVLDGGAATVNYITNKGAASGGTPIIGTAGSDANIDLTFTPKGTGNSVFSSGRVGIGTASPVANLVVAQGSATNNKIRLEPTTGNAWAISAGTNLLNIQNDANSKQYIQLNSASDFMSFATNTTERLRIDLNGNVGIGTASPAYPLEVSGNIKGTQLLAADGSQGAVGLGFAGNSGVGFYRSGGAAINTSHGWGGTNGWSIGPTGFSHQSNVGVFLGNTNSVSSPAVQGTNTSGTGIYFPSMYTVGISTNSVERLRVDASGNVGIGTPTPQAALDLAVTGASSAMIVPRDSTVNRPTTAVNGMIRYNTTLNKLESFTNGAWQSVPTGTGSDAAFINGGNSFGVAASLGTNDANSLTFKTNNTAQAVIDTAGKMGIGTSAPLSKLDVNGGVAIGSYAATAAAPANGMIVSGNVGIGTSAPGTPLDVQSASGNSIAKFIYTGSTSGGAEIKPSNGWSATQPIYSFWYNNTTGVGNPANNVFSIITGGSERVRVDASGNVGIGTTAPSAPLHTVGNVIHMSGNVGIGTATPNSALEVKGTGGIRLDGSTSGYVGIQPPASPTAYTMTLPPAVAGTNNSVLASDTSGNLSWISLSAVTGSVSLTGQVSGVLPVANGGTGQSNLSSYGLLVGAGTSGVTSVATGSAGQILQSGGASANPTWSTATYPSTSGTTGTMLRSNGTNFVSSSATFADTYAASALLYSNGANTVTGLTTANTGALITNSSGVPSWTQGTTANRLLRTDGTTISFAQANLTSDVTGTLPVSNGGTGLATLAANSLLYGNGTGAMNSLAAVNSAVLTTTAGGVPQWSTISSDTFTQYALLAGRSGGQTLNGGTAASNNLTLDSTSNVTKGYVLLAPSGGNVGIGTTAPLAKLHVSGKSYLYDGNVVVNTGMIATNSTSVPLVFGINEVEKARIDTVGNMGVGTSTPGSRFHVAGSGAVMILQDTAYGTASNSLANYISLRDSSGTEYGWVGDGSGTSNDMTLYNFIGNVKMQNPAGYLLLNTSGNVGIGTTTPTYPLDIASPSIVALRLNGTVGNSSSNNTQLRWAGGKSGELWSLGTDVANNNGSKDFHFYALPSAGNVMAMTLQATTGNVGIGTSAPSAPLHTVGNVLHMSGNVGIGTSAPGAALDVKGAIRLSGSTSGYVGFQPAAAAGSTVYTLPTADGGANQVLTTNGSGTLTWSTPTGTGVMSIGVTAPLASTGGTTPTLSIAQATTSANGYLSSTDWNTFNNKAPTASPTFTGTPLAPTAALNTNTTQLATTAFVLGQASTTNPLMDGTVAVGTGTTFARADHVHPVDTSRAPAAGSTSITTLGTITTGTWNATDIGVLYGGTGTSDGSITGTGALTFTAGGTNQNVTLTPSGTGYTVLNGNVGIGTTAPGQKLEVNGNIKMSAANPYLYSGGSYIVIPNGLYVSGGTPYFETQIQARGGVHNDTAAYLQIDGGTSGYTYFSGNVGVGTTAPGAKLEIVGQARSISASGGGARTNASASIDWNFGNTQTMSVDCSSTTFSNLLDGGSYTLAVTETGTTTCVFAQSGLTFYYSPANGPRVSGKRTVYSFQRIGSDVYVTWTSGFQ